MLRKTEAVYIQSIATNEERGKQSTTDHKREEKGGNLDLLQHPHDGEEEELNESEEVNAAQWHVTQEHVVGLILGGHE